MTKVEHLKVMEIKEDSLFEKRMYNLFSASISDQVSLPGFRKLFSKYEKMDAYIIKKNNTDIGLVYFMYCKDPKNPKNIYIRPGIGIVEEERGAYFPKKIIMIRMIKTKLENIGKKVFMVSITMNPLVYISACKYWKYVYPKPTRNISDKIFDIKESIVGLFNLNEVRKNVIEIPFSIPNIEETKKKFSGIKTENAFINYFASTIKDEECNRGVLTIIPISSINLFIAISRKFKADLIKFANKVFELKINSGYKEYSTTS